MESITNEKSKNVKSTELVEVIPDGLKEYNMNEFDDEGFYGEQSFSKMQMVKNTAVYMVKSFVHDLKSFAMFCPLVKTASFITFVHGSFHCSSCIKNRHRCAGDVFRLCDETQQLAYLLYEPIQRDSNDIGLNMGKRHINLKQHKRQIKTYLKARYTYVSSLFV